MSRKDFEASHDSWVQRKFLTPLALQAYERFLTEHVRFCEERAKNSKLLSLAKNLRSALACLSSFTGHDRYSVLCLLRRPLLPFAFFGDHFFHRGDIEDVRCAPNAPTAGGAVAPISTSSSRRVLRRPTHYKDTRR
jgi:hypothetical protein